MRKTRHYTCIIVHGGGFGGGFGSTYETEFNYSSEYRAGSMQNELDALRAFNYSYGRAGWREVKPGSVSLIK